MKLVIAEKPSVAMSIAKVIGANKRCDGYVEGNGYIVSWCIGHLIQMSNPDKYDEKYKKWNISDLPIVPEFYKYEVNNYTKKQYKVLKKLFMDKRVIETINACDAGREGELIFRLVYEQAKCKKPIKRLWISSMEDSAIKEGIDNLKDGKVYENLYASALARAQADWLIGMNLSRFYSCTHNKNYSVGRVQTPTLSMIVERDREIKEFKRQKYFTVAIITDGMVLETDRIDDIEEARKLKSLISDEIIITDVQKQKKEKNPDKLYDLTTLQRECNKYFGYSAKQTLDYAQSLYEKKLITYPRTDSRYLTEDMLEAVKEYVETFGPDMDEKNFRNMFNSSKVTDHHAIIPTMYSIKYDTEELQESEAKVFELIKEKLLSARSGNLILENTKIETMVEGYRFTATGVVVKDPGYTKYMTTFSKKKENKVLPEVEKGMYIRNNGSEIKEKYTKAPSEYTEDTLLKAMELAGNKEIGNVHVERKGLGTPATRAGIIENLIKKEFIKRDKKKLVPTDKGEKLINMVAEFIKSPVTTAKWEMDLYKIAEGEMDACKFIVEIENMIKNIVSKT